MRHERFEPMEYANVGLMDELNDFCIALKVGLYPERYGDKLERLQRKYPKPDLSEIDQLQQRINEVLKKDANPMRRY